MTGMPAARAQDPTAQGGPIIAGSQSVFIGGMADGEADCPCKHNPATGNPVNPILGIKVIPDETDFELPSPAPFSFMRSYASDDARIGPLGQGWSIGLASMSMEVTEQATILIDSQGRRIHFGPLAPGQIRFSESENIWLRRAGDEKRKPWDKGWDRRWGFVPESIQRNPKRIVLLRGNAALIFAPLESNPTCWRFMQAIDRNGYTTTYSWTPEGLPHTVRDSAGRVYCFVYHNNAPDAAQPVLRLSGVFLARNPNQHFDPKNADWLVRYYFDQQGNLTQVENRAGEIVRRFEYRDHIMVANTYLHGAETSYTYDEYTQRGKVIVQEEKDGLTRHYRYFDGYTEVEDSLGRVEYYEFEGEGGKKRWTAHHFADGSVKRFEYNAAGQLFKTVDELDRPTYVTLDGEGRRTGITSPDGKMTHIKVDDATGLPIEIDAPTGRTRIEYDSRGNQTLVTVPEGSQTRFSYENPKLPDRATTITDARGGIKRMTWTPFGQLESRTDCSGNTYRFAYDDEGRKLEEINPLGQRVRYEYDRAGRLTKVILPNGNTVVTEYDARGRKSASVSPLGERTTYDYDSVGRRVSTTNPAGLSLNSTYDAAGRLICLTNENGAKTRFTWDVRDRLVREVGFDGRTQLYRYNFASELIEREGNGSILSMERDEGGRLLALHLPATEFSGATTYTFEYNMAGRLERAKCPEVCVEYAYDKAGHPVAETQIHADGWRYQVTRQYSPLGFPQSTQYTDAPEIQWLTYGSGHLHGVEVGGETVLAFERDVLHREIERQMGGLLRLTQWDEMGRPHQHCVRKSSSQTPQILLGGVIWQRDYTFDALSQLRQVDDSAYGSLAYTYDKSGRLIESRHDQTEHRYRFDPAGNRLSVLGDVNAIDPMATGIETRSVPDNRVMHFDGHSLHYDTAGNLIEKIQSDGTMFTFGYDALNRIVTMERHSPNDSVIRANYVYDVFNRRISKTVAQNGITRTTRFGWEGGRMCAEAKDGKIRTIVYEPGSHAPLMRLEKNEEPIPPDLVQLSQILAQQRMEIPLPKMQANAVQLTHFHTDHLGTPFALTTADGKRLWWASPDDWGAVKGYEEGTDQPIRFQGQFEDEESGLYYNFNRYYDPQMGQYVTQDPIGLDGGNNLYSYAQGDPVNSYDPFGEAPRRACGLLGVGQIPCPADPDQLERCVDGCRSSRDFCAARLAGATATVGGYVGKIPHTGAKVIAATALAVCSSLYNNKHCNKIYDDCSASCRENFGAH